MLRDNQPKRLRYNEHNQIVIFHSVHSIKKKKHKFSFFKKNIFHGKKNEYKVLDFLKPTHVALNSYQMCSNFGNSSNKRVVHVF